MTKAEFKLWEAKCNVSFFEYDRDQLKDRIQNAVAVDNLLDRLDLEKTLAKLHVARDVVTELQRNEL